MENKLYWSKISASDMDMIGLSYEDFFKLLDCYYGNIFITDGEGYILYLNKWGWNTVGMERKKYLGKHVKQLVEDGIFKYSVTMKVLETKQPADMEAIDLDGKKFWVHAVPVFDDDDNILFTVHYNQYENEISKFLAEIERNKAIIEQMRELIERYSENSSSNIPLIHRSTAMAEVLSYARRIAKTDGSVLIEGESGTGKELLAHYIYSESLRSKGAFFPINCAAIPRDLIESELFGYVSGAFTGASKNGKTGVFELANNGTIFLDEVGELPLKVQSKLLRVLESGEIIRIGSAAVKKVDVRIIAATNRNLQDMVENNTFRSDLYYRLNVLPLKIPPLRDRPEDIPLLADFFLEKFNRKYHTQKHFSPNCIDAFVQYAWPGNVRELKNLIHRMVVATDRLILDQPNLPSPSPQKRVNIQTNEIALEYDLRAAMQEFEREYINRAIALANGNITKAAEWLGVHRTYIYRRLKPTDREKKQIM